MSLACSRSLFFMAFIAGALGLGVSYYLEYAVGLLPCGLCLMQRLCLALFTAVCLAAAVHGAGRAGSFVYGSLGLACSLAGTAAAWRQVVLQSNAASFPPSCSATASDLIANTPWMCVLQEVFSRGVDCAQLSWTLFDLSVPEWSLLFFVAVTLLGICQLLRLAWIACERPLGGESTQRLLAGD